MIAPLVLKQVAAEIGAQLHNADGEFSRVSTDTRTLQPGDLFVALRGENFDAHDFLPLAAKAGASGLVVVRKAEKIQLPQLIVKDTVAALGQIAALNRRAFHQPLIAITGSNGKTTVKGMVASILDQCGKVLATRGNLNNHIGVPLTLLELGSEHDYAVIEMGASAMGEIAYLADLAKPDVALINNIMAAHVEGFGSIDGVAKAKSEIFTGLNARGKAIVNLDDGYADQIRRQVSKFDVIAFSTTDRKAHVHAVDSSVDSDGRMQFTLRCPDGDIDVQMGVMGYQNMANALAAAACSYAVGANCLAIKTGLESFAPVAGRMEMLKGEKGALVIDDTYNANPGSVKAAIDTLADRSGEKVLVLGDLRELGDASLGLHQELGVYGKKKGLDRLITVGKLSANTCTAFGVGAEHFNNQQEAIDRLHEIIHQQMVLLIKGSRSARMERVVQAISQSGEQ